MKCENCPYEIAVTVPIWGTYFCSRDCFTKWSQRRNEASVKSDVLAARAMCVPRRRFPQEMELRDGNRVKVRAVAS